MPAWRDPSDEEKKVRIRPTPQPPKTGAEAHSNVGIRGFLLVALLSCLTAVLTVLGVEGLGTNQLAIVKTDLKAAIEAGRRSEGELKGTRDVLQRIQNNSTRLEGEIEKLTSKLEADEARIAVLEAKPAPGTRPTATRPLDGAGPNRRNGN